MAVALKPLIEMRPPAEPLLTLADFDALPEGPPDSEFDGGRLIALKPEGYLAVARVAAGEVFRPQLFPELAINLVALLGEAVAQGEAQQEMDTIVE